MLLEIRDGFGLGRLGGPGNQGKTAQGEGVRGSHLGSQFLKVKVQAGAGDTSIVDDERLERRRRRGR